MFLGTIYSDGRQSGRLPAAIPMVKTIQTHPPVYPKGNMPIYWLDLVVKARAAKIQGHEKSTGLSSGGGVSLV